MFNACDSVMAGSYMMPQGMVGPVAMRAGGPPGPDPANNNMPLRFNNDKDKPPGTVTRGNSVYDDRPDDAPSSTTPAEGMMQPGPMMSAPGMFGMGFAGPMNMMGPDPNMMMMGPMGLNQFGAMNMMGPAGPYEPGMGANSLQRGIITLKSCVLYPPPPGAPPRSVREKPPGCRTAFIGGLPETITEDILIEVFEKCGNIFSIRLSKKNFAHVRFEYPESVDRAIFISGYRMKIDNKDDKPNTGRIHVDYAMARDDQYEYECQQRMMARDARHQQRQEEEWMRPPSPSPVTQFTEHEAATVAERLKSDEQFVSASEILITWLERGDCNRRTANTFYSMIQSLNAHIRLLLSEKQQHEEELAKMKQKHNLFFQDLLRQFGQIEKVFTAALKQKSWDHFTRAQRRNIDIWFRQCQEIKRTQQEEFLNERQEDEMEMSDPEDDGEGVVPKKRKIEGNIDFVGVLKDENDTLKCQVEAYKNEVDLIKQESQNNIDEKEKQIKALQNVLQGMQKQLISKQQEAKRSIEKVKEQVATDDGDLAEKTEKPSDDFQGSPKPLSEETGTRSSENSSVNQTAHTSLSQPIPEAAVTSSGISFTEKEAKLLGLICCFLHVHPFGATVDYLWSYLHQLIPVRPREVEDILERLPMLFEQELKGVGARLERRWVFVGYSAAGNTET